MDAIAEVTQRISEIQTKLSALQPPPIGAFASYLASSTASATSSLTTPTSAGLDAATLASASVRPSWASGTTSTSATSLSTATGTKATGKVTVPDELRVYGNGRIPASALETIGQGSHRLAAKAAQSFKAMEAAAAADGVELDVTDSYRDYDTQVDLVRRKGLYSEGGLAAKPGTSNHGWGLAVDLDLDDEQQAWMRANGARFGFVEDTPREPWHWGFHG